MKKVLSVVLAVAMLFAVCVPAFAATDAVVIDQTSTDKSGDVSFSTTTKTADEWYSVVIPADFTVAWNDTSAKSAAAYKLASQLKTGASLTVTVAAKDGNATMTASGTSEVLEFTLAGDGTETNDDGALVGKTYNEINGSKDASGNITYLPDSSTTVAITSFTGKPVAVYTGHITYTVTYNAPAATEPTV